MLHLDREGRTSPVISPGRVATQMCSQHTDARPCPLPEAPKHLFCFCPSSADKHWRWGPTSDWPLAFLDHGHGSAGHLARCLSLPSPVLPWSSLLFLPCECMAPRQAWVIPLLCIKQNSSVLHVFLQMQAFVQPGNPLDQPRFVFPSRRIGSLVQFRRLRVILFCFWFCLWLGCGSRVPSS